MTESDSSRDTGRLERWLSRVLGWGSAISASLLALGLLLELMAVRKGPAAALDSAGLMILMATPMVRVAASVGEYLLARDWLFAALTGTVLVTLLASLMVAVR
jgi:uncharacterized membrane protein